MEEELRELRDLVAQLRADNVRLQQEQAAVAPGPSAAPSIPEPQLPSTFTTPATERLVLVPRDRKCPVFRGRSGIGLEEWVEETQACIRASHMSNIDQAFFLFDHLEGEAREEINQPLTEATRPKLFLFYESCTAPPIRTFPYRRCFSQGGNVMGKLCRSFPLLY